MDVNNGDADTIDQSSASETSSMLDSGTTSLEPELGDTPMTEENNEIVECGCLALHPLVHWFPRYIIPLLILLDIALFVSSNTGTIL